MPFHRPIPDDKPPAKASSGLDAYIEAEKLLHIVFVLPAAVFIGWAAGWWADQRLHQTWIEFAGIVFGSFAGLIYVIREAIAHEKNSRKQESAQKGSGDGSPDDLS